MPQSYSLSSFPPGYHNISGQGMYVSPFSITLTLESAVRQERCAQLSCWKAIRSSNTVSFIEANGYASKSEDDGDNATRFLEVFSQKLNAFYRFSRPHTVIGTIIGILSVALLPVVNVADLTPTFFMGLLKALVPSILMNIYIVGLNQLFDVEIDKVNKPYLPLASGDFSMGTGTAIVSAALLMSLGMGIISKSLPLVFALLIGGLLGTVYSVEHPFLRWKRHPFLAASCILFVRALVIQLAFFIHTQKYVLGRPIVITKSLLFATAFMCFFSAVIALFKDIPDIDGDRYFGIQSFSVSLGQERVFWLCVQMLLMAYGAAVMVGASSSSLSISKLVTVRNCALFFKYWATAHSPPFCGFELDLLISQPQTDYFCLLDLQLFYAEYFLIPFVR
ncbi:hypothetical protein Pint_12478 [Pistacia integerrima]|uniref:Uncharacterized protein n=1 Tax=Pistacia integerrima TaxID=434235 RepID=A0ACC0Y8H4_9ROSI|nr:hypothetical protein Pint_12478 [Pistacia integerrima]